MGWGVDDGCIGRKWTGKNNKRQLSDDLWWTRIEESNRCLSCGRNLLE